MVQIIPAILATTEEDFERDISRYKHSSSFREGWVHIDFMDNQFVQNHGIDPVLISKYPIPFQKEAHLMVKCPKEWIDKLAEAGFERIFFHLESDADIDECIDHIKKDGAEAGLVLNNDTPLEKLGPYISKIDAVILMSVVPGFQGRSFIEDVLDKIKDFKSKGWPVKVGVDGAVKDTNIKKLVDAGADFVIVGSYLLMGDIDENLENLWEAVEE